MPKAAAYEVLEATEVLCTDPQTGRFEVVKLEKGPVSPKNEHEEVALEAAVVSGVATRPKAKTAVEPTQEAKL